ncbi:hypothetical protein H2198_005714 [Neophaeococcomyces mojaviensis]|uniref:Uncharacterized protein n=1 Tax=Neophaeococcomyces mojaviensis TaxID=3383035 RepID=A0ACC3A596_9EURO|nr:hypothetical protein H2198_005714 [Knufia sp. JES_112]
MISFLDDLASHAADSNRNLRICLSSRHYPHISIPRGLSLTIEDEAEHDADIHLYIRKKLVKASTPKMQVLCEKLYKKSAHVFLWIVLVIPMLNGVHSDGGTTNDTIARLNEISADLDGLFADILARTSKDVGECVCLLQWVLFAFRPLKEPELYLAIHSSSPNISCIQTDQLPHALPDADDLERFLLNTSRGLVELTRAKPPVVQFIHETVRHFLMSPNGLGQLEQTLSTNLEGLSHDILKTGCITYIKSCKYTDGYRASGEGQQTFMKRLADDFPLMEYALSNMYKHADKAQACDVEQIAFINARKTAYGMWYDHHFNVWRDSIQYADIRKYHLRWPRLPLAYFLADQNLPNLLEASIATGININLRGGRYGSPLQAACVVGNLPIVKLLLRSGANVNAQGGEHRHALVAAILCQKYDITDVLRRHGAKVHEKLLSKTLGKAVSRGSRQGVQAALDSSADADCIEVADIVCLEITRGNTEVVEMLSRCGAKIQQHDVLLSAVRTRDIEMVKAVFKLGTQSHHDLTNGFALYKAAINGDIAIAQLLIESGADPNRSYTGYSTLSEAIARRKADMVQLLLDNKADLCVYDEDSPVPLMLFEEVEEVHEQAVNKLYSYCGDDLQFSLWVGDLDIAKALLSHGADVNGAPGTFGCAIEVAALSEHDELLKLVLEAGARIGGDSFSFVAKAIEDGRTERVKLYHKHAERQGCTDLLRLIVESAITLT